VEKAVLRPQGARWEEGTAGLTHHQEFRRLPELSMMADSKPSVSGLVWEKPSNTNFPMPHPPGQESVPQKGDNLLKDTGQLAAAQVKGE
jgi:hypothetical protein